MRRSSNLASVLIALAAAGSLSACGAAKKKIDLSYEERPVEQLYNAGADRLDRRQWRDAVSYFEEVERQHPYSEWARRAILMTAYAHYSDNDYEDAMGDADRFISLYPGNPSAAYAYYLKAVCYFEQIVDVNRDQAATEQALNSLRDVVKRYPGTSYAQDARAKIDLANDQLAGKEMTVGRYYLRQGLTLAAIGRFRNVVDRYQTTSHTPEALYRLVEAYLTLGLRDEAVKDGSVLGFNFPGERWYQDAYAMLTNKGLRPAVAPRAHRGFRVPLPRLPGRRALPPPAPATAQTAAAAAVAPLPAAVAVPAASSPSALPTAVDGTPAPAAPASTSPGAPT